MSPAPPLGSARPNSPARSGRSGSASAWERRDATPHTHKLAALADALGVATGHLVDTGSMRGRRYGAGLTQAEAADLAGVNAVECARWKSGLAMPTRHQPAVREVLHR